MTSPAELPEPDDRRARLRAADADRELVHQILAAAMSNGNLTPAEYEDRAGKVVVAKTFGELDELTDDLPVGQLGVPIPFRGEAGATRVTSGSGLQPVQHTFALMSGSRVGGRAAVGDSLTATAVMGGVEIDLRQVEFTAPSLTIRCTAIMGGIDITVAPDVSVETHGLAVLGGFDSNADGAGTPGAPSVRVTGLALMGGVSVKRKERGER